MEFPVLMGSQALAQYGWKLEDPNLHDWDIICTDKQNIELQKLSTKKEWIWGTRENFHIGDIRVDCLKFQKTKKKLYEYCNKIENQKKLEHPVLGTLIIPSLQLLYAFKKAHIHRILHHHPSNLENAKVWRTQVLQYNWMRQTLGYKRMDEILFNPNAEPNDKPENETNDLNKMTKELFFEEFNEVTIRVGDTTISMSKTEKEFFTDGVTRFIDHDELHKKVAQVCRQTDELLFEKFIQDKNKVEMDKGLFLAANRQTQIQTIKEEIIVLLLERKLIPTMVRNRDLGICYDGLNPERRQDEMIEIVAHFMTNLCGQGHHWLRRWCIDHFQFFDPIQIHIQSNIYPHEEIDKIAVQVSQIQDMTEKLSTMEGITFTDFIFKGPILRTIKEERYGDTIVSTHDLKIDYYKDKHTRNKVFGSGKNKVIFKCMGLENPENIESYTLEYHFDSRNPIIQLILRRMTTPAVDELGYEYKSQYIFKANNVVYDPFSNIGIVHAATMAPITLFRVSNIIDDYTYNYNTKDMAKEYSIHLEQISLENPENITANSKAWMKNTFNYWYYSEQDDTCEWQNKIETSRSYLSSYGTMPNQLSQLFESLARYHLGVLKDEKKFKRGAMIGDEYVQGSRDQFSSSDSDQFSSDD